MRVIVYKPHQGEQQVLVLPNVRSKLRPVLLRGSQKGMLFAEVNETLAAVDLAERPVRPAG